MKKKQNKKFSKMSINNMKISYKLIGAFAIVAFLSGFVGIYSVFQLNTLEMTVTEIIDVNVAQADYSMETSIDLKTQVISIHAAMLGEEGAATEFNTADTDIKQGFNELETLLVGTSHEDEVEHLEEDYIEFLEKCNGSNGVFASMENYQVALQRQKELYLRIDELLDELDDDLETLEELVIDYAIENAIAVNSTLTDNAMELNLLLWRSSDRARMYMATELNDSAEHTALRQQISSEYADLASILNESSFVQTGLEKEFTDLMNETETNFAQAVIAGQANVTMTLLLSEVKSEFQYDEENDYNFATAIRCQEDGVFVVQDDLVAKWIAADDAIGQADEIGAEMISELEDLETWVEQQLDLAAANSKQIYETALLFVAGFAIVAIIIGVLFGFFISRSITKPLEGVVNASTMVAEKNLVIDFETLDTERRDEVGILGQSIGEMVNSLSRVLRLTQNSSEEVASSAQELASTSEEVNALSEEIAATVQQISRGSTTQTELSIKATEEIQQMSDVVDKSLKDIENALGVIDDIAGQTNILALNAAIEAARAGEYGRGFAVVADNVRRLAEETKVNSGDIGKLTNEIISNIGTSVLNLQETLQSFAAQSEEFSASGEEVAAATEQQTAAMNQMTTAAQDLTKLGEELAQQTASFILAKEH